MTPEKATKFQENNPDCMVIDSEVFPNTHYIYKHGEGIIIDADKSGKIAIASPNVHEFIEEFKEIIKTYFED